MADNEAQGQMPTPDLALERLDRFVGTWNMEGHLVGSSENNIKGRATYRWLPDRFFLEQPIQLDFMGLQVDSQELIGYDRDLPLDRLLEHVAGTSALPVEGR